MKQLNRIVLVNWYVLGAQEIPIKGNVAIVGPNGSGKSSLLDAMQTILMGGHKRHLSFNASAGEKSERSLRTYCLGFMDDGGKSNSAREDSISYLAMSFFDTETAQESCIGVAISASTASPDEEVLGRFILPNFSVSLDDFSRKEGGGRMPRPWNEVRESLLKQCPDMTLEKRASRYIREVVTHLSHDPAMPNDDDKFIKNFKNALKFVPIDSPTRFVREFVLDENVVHVGAFRKSLDEYRAMEEKTRDVANRIDELVKVQELCQGISRNIKNAVEYEWVVHESRFESADLRKEEAEERLEKWQEQEAEVERELTNIGADLNQVMQDLANARAALNNTDAAHQINAMESSIRVGQHELNVIEERIQKAYSLMRTAVSFNQNREFLPEEFAALVDQASEIWRSGENLMADAWPSDPVSVDNTLNAMRKSIENVRRKVSRRYEESVIRISELRAQIQNQKSAVEQLQQGRAPVRRNTAELMELLSEYGIDSTPICELVDITDDKWRIAIESFLGARREALVVDPDRVKEAITLYRRKGRHLKGCRIINTTKSGDWLHRTKPGSLAQFIESDSDDARAFMNRALGGVMAVETEAELLKQERALTYDCMLQTEGSTTSINELTPIMGIRRRGDQLELQGKQVDQLVNEFTLLGRQHESLEKLRDALISLDGGLSQVNEPLFDLTEQRKKLTHQIEGYQQTIVDLRNHDDTGIQQRIADLAAKQKETESTQAALMDKLQKARTGLIRDTAQLEVLETDLTEHAEARAACEAKNEFDAQSAQEKRDYLDESCDGELERIIFEAAKKAQSELALHEKKKNGVRDAVAQYKARHHGGGLTHHELDKVGPDSSHEDLEGYVNETVEALRESELAEYTEKAERARLEAESAFRSDFVAHLNDQINKIRDLIRELNSHLKNRPFHKEMYSFEMSPNPELKDILELVEAYTQLDSANVGSLFDMKFDDNAQHKDALERIHEVLKDEGESSLLQDYRNFYNFELVVKDLDGNRKTTLSQRIKTGSGGEHQVPFYVAMAAALGATYRLKEGSDGKPVGGFSLSVFDEAFNKLDSENTVTSLGFMSDLGLQTIIAAPDEKYSLLSTCMDTIINVCRDGRVVDIDVEFPTDLGKALLASDHPYKVMAEEEAAEL
ncbi:MULTISPECIES: SbcC/MukB-like Walker B domain-containing protein [unclassified Marinobacterium]|jgi:energy-coupling factor transporter ATP-binding protein EcfA2|uniref:SbcC/MukB-like Walker B domain-containing protein n=1 Tax=unclassified Marinobacterium TaxID=2644139 RepID=UPI001567F1FB|nr:MULTISPECIES: SbcC/MukB-like Walker B domain-containing protein [unclassified Marinobacterium]NRP10055.1 Chromosome partition protein Smc [Marinobacterium sp. xm-g-48]NRP16332.1 Chromosome partition protein Smc [Marinobacterium sp. xm-a-152]NRP27064.1 Chromosome partition protein Smc [Marinobacterium sp. xm-d-420]NRP36503.1 Chromosome partition protein Smc [Marinobacterium sp. xm-d-579]NRP48056.1 Chromosome partition protein Smc [Marinobacterium sp. xm-d-543]